MAGEPAGGGCRPPMRLFPATDCLFAITKKITVDQPVGEFVRIFAAAREMFGEYEAHLAYRLGHAFAGLSGTDALR
jgi:hypothetical protein